MTVRFWWDTYEELGFEYTLIAVKLPDVVDMYLDEIEFGYRVWDYLHSNVGTLEDQLLAAAPKGVIDA